MSVKRVRSKPLKRDPVIAALIAKVPADGAPFDRAQRVNWLRMIAMAFDGAFGVTAPIGIDAAAGAITITGPGEPMELPNVLAARPAPIAVEAEPDEIRFYIDADGFARKEPGNGRIKPFDVTPGATLEDERVDDDSLETIKWADGPWPPGAYPHPLTIVKA